ncbi:MAG: hypothetical protein KDJ73_05315 [Notoacmeibacter sp.]|nr:hypothetical protein [Notoacmeibacter sp.]MCC0033542.1 hypothetical protein [Brucellaceae bacterium]
MFALTNPEPWTGEEVHRLAIQLNEAAAIGVPHGYLASAEDRRQNGALLAKVEEGAVLDAQASAAYRRAYQAILAENQSFLARFDAELSVLRDHAPDIANNDGGAGIPGRHDHHDLSARRNFSGLLSSLQSLDEAKGIAAGQQRIVTATRAYKDLVDLISHLGVAPHTVSVPYKPAPKPWPDARLGNSFEAMLAAFKEAQFEPVNSPAYWAAIDRGIAAYEALILAVQERIVERLQPWERRFSGRFLSPQTLAPPVTLDRVLRKRP